MRSMRGGKTCRCWRLTLPQLPCGQVAERDRCYHVYRLRGGQGECRGICDRGGVVRSVRGGKICRYWWLIFLPRLSSGPVAERDRRVHVRIAACSRKA